MLEIDAFVRRRSSPSASYGHEGLTTQPEHTTADYIQRRPVKRPLLRDQKTGLPLSDYNIARQSYINLLDSTPERSSSLISNDSDLPPNPSPSTGVVVASPLDRHSPAASTINMSLGKKTSFKTLLCDKAIPSDSDPIDIDAAVKLLHELRKRATPEDLVALHAALLPIKADTTAPANAQDVALSPYSRRSSFSAPGRATRAKSPSAAPKSGQTGFLADLISPLKRRPFSESSAQPTISATASAFQTSLPVHRGIPSLSRSFSPADLDIAAIGGLQIGSLRVTNGAATPEPSVISEPDVALDESTCHPHLTDDRHVPDIDESEDDTGCATPKASMRSATPHQLRERPNITIIPGLEIYADSSDEDDAGADLFPGQQMPYTHHRARSSMSHKLYTRAAFNASADSFISRLSTIQDDESIIERAGTPAHALEILNGLSDDEPSTMHHAKVLRPLQSNPRMHKKHDSAVDCRLPDPRSCFSSTDNLIIHKTTEISHTPARSANLPLETILSVGTVLDGASPMEAITLQAAKEDQSLLDYRAHNSRVPDTPERETPSVAGKARKRLSKPPPTKRSNSDLSRPLIAPPETSPAVSEESSVNFSRRVPRAAGSYHREHIVAAHSLPSEESLTFEEMLKYKTPADHSTQPETPLLDAVEAPNAPTMPESGLRKRRSLFRLCGRTRSKSTSRPETNLPPEKNMPTVQAAVPQYNEKPHLSSPTSQPRMKADNLPPTRPRCYSRPSWQRSEEGLDRFDPATPMSTTTITAGIDRRHRSQSVPRSKVTGHNRKESDKSQNSQRPRSKTVAPTDRKCMPMVDIPPAQDSDQSVEESLPKHAQDEPRTGSRQTSRDRRSSLFSRNTSAERKSRSRSKPRKGPEVTSPAYIASQYPTPPATPHELAQKPSPSALSSTPRSLPWDTHTVLPSPQQRQQRHQSTPSGPLTQLDANARTPHARTASSPGAAYRAYRHSDAMPLADMTSPTKPSRDPPPTPARDPPPKPARDPPSVPDRFGGGLDYGWERGAGFQSSAGLRGEDSRTAARKCAGMSERWGVDLSDVPVFVQREM